MHFLFFLLIKVDLFTNVIACHIKNRHRSHLCLNVLHMCLISATYVITFVAPVTYVITFVTPVTNVIRYECGPTAALYT